MRDGVSCAATSDFNAPCFSLLHQTCSYGADDEAEHRTKYYEPDRCICDGRPVRFESHLCVHIFSSAEPELIKNAQNRERQSAQHKNNFFEAVVPDDRCVVHDFRIATKQLIAPPVDENAGAQGKKQRNGECDAEQRYAGWFNGEKKSGRVHIDLTAVARSSASNWPKCFFVSFHFVLCDASISRVSRTTFQKI